MLSLEVWDPDARDVPADFLPILPLLGDVIMPSEKAIDARARRAAKRVGLSARKSRWRLGSVDNCGGFRLVDPYTNTIQAGERYDLSAEAVIEYCRE